MSFFTLPFLWKESEDLEVFMTAPWPSVRSKLKQSSVEEVCTLHSTCLAPYITCLAILLIMPSAKQEWGAVPGETYFVIELGKIIEENGSKD